MSARAGITSLVVVMVLLTSAVSVLATPVLSQTDQPSYNANLDYGPKPAIVGTPTTLYVQFTMVTQSGTTGFPPAGTSVIISIDDPNTQIPASTDSAGLVVISHTFSSPGTYTVHFSTPSGDLLQSGTITVNAATPTPQQPTATPQATVVKPTLPPTAPQAQPTIIIYVPPPTVINQVFPGTVTQGTNSQWGTPQVTVTQQGPDKLRTTLIDFAKNPEDNTAHYNQQVGAAKAGGWTLTAQGEKTYGDSSKDTRYSRFVKGTSTLSFTAQGNNSTDKQYAIPGDVLITDKNETFSTGTAGFSLFGLEGFAAYGAVAVIVIALLALIVVAALYYRRQGADQQQYYPRR